jgi:RNA polymerase sigma factor for flagellar operon FliA
MPIALGEGSHRGAPDRPETPAHVIQDWRLYKQGGSVACRNRLVNYYMGNHVRPIAARVHAGLPHQVDLDDLIQQGYLGLIDAMDRYELERDVRFETFSRRRIFGSIQDYLRSVDTVPRLTRSRAKQFQAANERFRKQHGRPPTEDDLRPMLDLPEPVFRRFVTDHQPAAMVPFSHVHPDGPAGEGDDADAMDAFEDHDQSTPDRDVERQDLQHWVTRGLEPRDRLIVVLYYYEQMTMMEIGRVIGISESRVSQRLESILGCLRARLTGAGAEHEFVFA